MHGLKNIKFTEYIGVYGWNILQYLDHKIIQQVSSAQFLNKTARGKYH